MVMNLISSRKTLPIQNSTEEFPDHYPILMGYKREHLLD